MLRARMNIVARCHSGFVSVSASRTGLRIRNDEVVGSSPTSSTRFSSTRAPIALPKSLTS